MILDVLKEAYEVANKNTLIEGAHDSDAALNDALLEIMQEFIDDTFPDIEDKFIEKIEEEGYKVNTSLSSVSDELDEIRNAYTNALLNLLEIEPDGRITKKDAKYILGAIDEYDDGTPFALGYFEQIDDIFSSYDIDDIAELIEDNLRISLHSCNNCPLVPNTQHDYIINGTLSEFCDYYDIEREFEVTISYRHPNELNHRGDTTIEIAATSEGEAERIAEERFSEIAAEHGLDINDDDQIWIESISDEADNY